MTNWKGYITKLFYSKPGSFVVFQIGKDQITYTLERNIGKKEVVTTVNGSFEEEWCNEGHPIGKKYFRSYDMAPSKKMIQEAKRKKKRENSVFKLADFIEENTYRSMRFPYWSTPKLLIKHLQLFLPDLNARHEVIDSKFY